MKSDILFRQFFDDDDDDDDERLAGGRNVSAGSADGIL